MRSLDCLVGFSSNTLILGAFGAPVEYGIEESVLDEMHRWMLKEDIKTNGRVIIGGSGIVSGKVDCNYADIEGKFSGELSVNSVLSLKATAKISGNVVVGKLSVEPGAEFNATCAMKNSTVKELKNGKTTKERTA